MPGDGWAAKLEAAQDTLVPKGGVVYLPSGTYAFKETIRLKNGIVLRGAPPAGVADARQES